MLQYEATLQDGLECGGAYLKFLAADDAFSPATLDGDSGYSVMFGPDKCGATNKVHVIFRHVSPLDGSVEEKHLKNPPAMLSDELPHLYTLVVKKDNTFEVRIDGESAAEGSLFENFEPPFAAKTQIDDGIGWPVHCRKPESGSVVWCSENPVTTVTKLEFHGLSEGVVVVDYE